MLAALWLSTALALQNGAYVEQERFPGTIAFYLSGSKKKCTAVHVAPKIFLTAAHCFDDYRSDGKIEFVANEKGPESEPRIATFPRLLVRAPVIQPDYFREQGFFGRLKRWFSGENPDLALIKTMEDIEELAIARVEDFKVRPGLSLLVGGFGPATPDESCEAAPCSIRMDARKITKVGKHELSVDAFLTHGDDGGPAYLVRPGGKLSVVAINQGDSRLTLIDHAWFAANLERLEEGRK